ncbi:MAG: cardiolipin synthase [Pigmentiphaga sp.]|nr:cardiolipin synthase [Pigmentiphaga sp.]
MTIQWFADWLLPVGWGLYIALLVGWIILQKRGPVATLSWILLLGALPVLGFIVYYYFGPQRLRRYRLRRLRSRAALSAQEASAQQQEAGQRLPAAWYLLSRLGTVTSDAPLSTAHSATLLVGGETKFKLLLADIREAQQHIHLEYYIYEPDITGRELLDALVAKAREGVTVRLLLDALGSVRTHRRFLAPLLQAGGEVAYFHDPRIGRRLRPVINFRTHRKIVVIDGRVGYTGGINVTDDGHEARSKNAHRDVHLRLQGGVVRWLQMVFLEDWLYATDQRQPPLEEMDVLLPACEPGRIRSQILHSGPNDERESIHRVWVAAIQNARRRVWITTPYFVPTEPGMMALTSAAMRGVDVRVLVPERSDSLIVTAAARSYYDELLAAGAKIWECPGNMLHAKTMLVDADGSWIGTANFDNRSLSLNFEVCAMVFHAPLAAEMSALFEELLLGSRQIEIRRPQTWPRRLFEAGMRLLSPLL